MSAFSSFFVVGVISLIASISPGPNFCVVLRNSLCHSRKMGFLTAFGVSLGTLVHLFYTLVGIGILITKSPYLYVVIKDVGAIYLFYLGLTLLLSSFKCSDAVDVPQAAPISSSKAVAQGFLTSVLNPRAALFYISLFSQFIKTSTPLSIKLAYAAINWSVTLGWFLMLAFLLTGKFLLNRMKRFQILVDRTIGGVLMMLSMILFLT